MPKYLSTGVKLGNANTWSALQTFSAGLTVSGGVASFLGGATFNSQFKLFGDGDQLYVLGTPGAGSPVVFSFRSNTEMVLASNYSLSWANGNAASGTIDLFLSRDAANTLAQRNGTSAQESRLFATYTSATQQHYMAFKTVTQTLSAVSGATVTATNLIPDGAFVIGVTTRVNTGLGVSLGTTGYQVGDGTDPDRWGAIVGTAAGTDSDNVDATANPTGAFTAANNVVLTAVGGNFDGTGAIEVAVMYITTVAD